MVTTTNKCIKNMKFTNLLNGRTKIDHHQLKNDKTKYDKDKMNSHLILNDDNQVNLLTNQNTNYTDYSTIINNKSNKTKTKINAIKKSTKISLFNTAIQSVKRKRKSTKIECNKIDNLYSIVPSVYLEEHKGMDWRLQQLGYQLPEQDERLLADNTHLSNELRFLKTQQKLCSIPVKLYINNEINQHNSSVKLNVEQEENLDNKKVNNNNNNLLFCNKCEQVINKSSYCVQADLSNLNFFLSTKTNNQPNNSAGTTTTIQSSIHAPALNHIYFHIDCLQCITCGEIIVDFRAFGDPRTNDLNSKLKIHCSRHFLELFKPRCDYCEELIFDKKCTQAEGRAFHVSHFCCFKCKTPLGGQQYKMADLNQKQLNLDDKMRLADLHSKFKTPQTKEIHPFCLSCCDQLFGEYCARCDKLITCDQNPVKFEKYFWHANSDCFYCDTCGVSLVNSDYLPSSSAKQIFCSTKCAQSLQAKDFINVNNGLMKLNDRLRNNNLHKPTLNSVKEEDYNSLESDQIDNKIILSSNKVEYENSSMFHLASNVNKNDVKCDNNLKLEEVNQTNSPSSNRSSNRSLSSLSLLFSSSPSSEQNDSNNSIKNDDQNFKIDNNKKEEQQSFNNQILTKNKNNSLLSIESDCLNESNQLNSSSTSTITKETLNDSNENNLNTTLIEKHEQSKGEEEEEEHKINDLLENQKLVPCVIVNNNPFARTSIIIDNFNTALSTMQILSDHESVVTDCDNNNKCNNSTNSNSSSNNDINKDNKNNLNNTTTTTNINPLEKKDKSELLNNLSNLNIKSKEENNSLLENNNNNNLTIDHLQIPTHYSTLPTRKTQRKPFKYEEPITNKQQIDKFNVQNVYHHYHHHHSVQNVNSSSSFKNNSSQFLINFNNYNNNNNNLNSINEIGLPILNNNRNINVSNFVNCTLPRNRNNNNTININSNQYQMNSNSNHILSENDYLNSVQSVSVSKLNAAMIQSTFNRLPAKYMQQHPNNSISTNTSTNSDFSTTSSITKNPLINNQTLNSHSVIISEDQLAKSLNSKLVVKPLPTNSELLAKNLVKLPTRQPPLPPPPPVLNNQQHGFIKKWSTTSSTCSSNNLKDSCTIKEQSINNGINSRTSSATPSLSSSNDLNEHQQNTNLISIQNFTSSNNSLNTMSQTTNLNSSNSASLISATSSINSTISSSNETTITTTTNLIHDRPDVISHLNPIETMKQLKEKQRELKLKEKMLKKAERQQQQQQQQQQQSIDKKPKIIEEKLKTSTPTGNKNKKVLEKENLNKTNNDNDLKNNTTTTTRTMSTNNLNTTIAYENKKLNNSVSNSLSSLNNKNRKISNNQFNSQPNLLIANNQHQMDSNGDTCSNSSTPNEIDYLNKLSHCTIEKLNNNNNNNNNNLSPCSSQYSPTNSVTVNDTDCSSIVNNNMIEMDNIVQFDNQLDFNSKMKQSAHKKQLSNKNCDTLVKQKSVSFDPNVIENENNKAPKRLNRKTTSDHHYRYSSSSKKKYSNEEDYDSHHEKRRRRRRRKNSNYHHDHYKSKSNSKRNYHFEDDDSVCSTCSSCSSSSSSFCSSSDEEIEENQSHNYSCNGRKSNHQTQKKLVSDRVQLTNQNVKSNLSKNQQMVQIMKQQQLIIQQHQLLAQQMQQPQMKQQRYLKNNTNESCVIS